jgi:hypothetical protein
VRFTFGGTLDQPALSKMVPAAALAGERKWTRFPAADVRVHSDIPVIGDFFKIRRGIATGNNDYFILSAEELEARGLPRECFRPILPSPRHLTVDEIEADAAGDPLIERRLFLLDPACGEDEIRDRFPSVWNYLEEGKAEKLHEGYLCSHRAPWYAQEHRLPAAIVCTYIGRGDTKSGRPFRFILNHSQATVANVYLAMYPTPLLSGALDRDPGLIRSIWQIFNRIPAATLLGEGRVYGGGLHKLEPGELANVPVPEIAELLPSVSRPARQTEMFQEVAGMEICGNAKMFTCRNLEGLGEGIGVSIPKDGQGSFGSECPEKNCEGYFKRLLGQ